MLERNMDRLDMELRQCLLLSNTRPKYRRGRCQSAPVRRDNYTHTNRWQLRNSEWSRFHLTTDIRSLRLRNSERSNIFTSLRQPRRSRRTVCTLDMDLRVGNLRSVGCFRHHHANTYTFANTRNRRYSNTWLLRKCRNKLLK